ncbi:SMAX1-LIKE 7-like protein [Tanacetum coccineum]
MPTPVNIARQCLSPESVQALDEAVTVANRRCHAQTSSLHVVTALLSLPSSPLRDACTRARNSAYASRIQFKAIELCLSVSLDRLATTPQRLDEPPVSNSLMAAIKRSQANQRRQPENFHMYQQMAAYSNNVSTVKVELQNLILSVLDDPVVSRVFGESGFRSSDIKISVLRPVHRGHPIFFCNLSSTNRFGFPFNGFLENNEIYKKSNEVRNNKKRRNPLLVGLSGNDTVRIYLETLRKTQGTKGDYVVSVKDEVVKFVCGNSDVSLLDVKLKEVGDFVSERVGCGVVVDYGDLKCLTGENESALDSVRVVVKKLAELVVLYGGRVWLIGYAESSEVCMQIFKMFPCVVEEWDLHVLPIDSIRASMAETYPKSSLMESFVPFGGFFSMPSDINNPLSISNYFGSLCHMCDDKFKLEVNGICKVGLYSSVSDPCRSSLPTWLQTSQLCSNANIDVAQAQDDPVLVSAKITGLQKKWQSICQRLHQGEPYMQMSPKATYTVGPRVPSVIGFKLPEHVSQNAGNHNTSSIESECNTITQSNSTKVKDTTTVCSLSSSSDVSGNSVTTDLGLGGNRSLNPLDQKDFKLVYSSLFTRVGRQEEALSVISQTITRRKGRSGPSRGGIWFAFMGPDRAAKKKTAVALAEVLLGSRQNLISVDLSNLDFMNGCDLKLRGKNVVDFIADELIRKQLSVVFLENVDMADIVTQHHLYRAVTTGRFSDSHGRDVSISNAIFVLTSNLFGVNEVEGCPVDYTEENVLKAKCGPIRVSTGFDLGEMKPSPKVVSVTPVCKNKRKLDCSLYLDLNQPADESDTDYDSAPENSNAWLEDVFKHVDEKVSFEAFDFDLLAEKILDQIGDCFEKTVGLDCSLEIDYKLMEQILKASYFLETKKTDNWIEQVLGEAFVEAQRKYNLGSHSVLKLFTAEMLEEQPTEVLLPDKIIMT